MVVSKLSEATVHFIIIKHRQINKGKSQNKTIRTRNRYCNLILKRPCVYIFRDCSIDKLRRFQFCFWYWRNKEKLFPIYFCYCTFSYTTHYLTNCVSDKHLSMMQFYNIFSAEVRSLLGHLCEGWGLQHIHTHARAHTHRDQAVTENVGDNYYEHSKVWLLFTGVDTDNAWHHMANKSFACKGENTSKCIKISSESPSHRGGERHSSQLPSTEVSNLGLLSPSLVAPWLYQKIWKWIKMF